MYGFLHVFSSSPYMCKIQRHGLDGKGWVIVTVTWGGSRDGKGRNEDDTQASAPLLTVSFLNYVAIPWLLTVLYAYLYV